MAAGGWRSEVCGQEGREERRGEERRRYRRTLEQARIELKNGRTRRIEAGRRGARWVATKWTSLVGG